MSVIKSGSDPCVVVVIWVGVEVRKELVAVRNRVAVLVGIRVLVGSKVEVGGGVDVGALVFRRTGPTDC